MKLLTKQEVMDKYKIAETTLYSWRKRGLPTKRVNPLAKGKTAKLVYPEKEIDRWLEKQRKQNKGE